MPRDYYEENGGDSGFYYCDDYTAKASMSLQPINGNHWPTGSKRLPGDTWDPTLPALPNWDPTATR